MPPRILTIGSRGSALALWQANFIAGKLNQLGAGARIEIIKTTGDRLQTGPVQPASTFRANVNESGKGLFTKEIEEALLAGHIDVAVHSLKDLPTELPPGLVIAAIPEREDAHDCLCGLTLDALPKRARVGTSSPRRHAQIRALRPDLIVEAIRGNVDTRLRKLHEQQYAAVVLAAAGLKRLGVEREIAQTFSADQICPAPGQGALAIETRESGDVRELCAQLDHRPSERAVACERAVLARLGGGCLLPVGAYAEADSDHLRVTAIVITPDGSEWVREHAAGPIHRAEELGNNLAATLLSRGAADILASIEPERS